MASLDYFGTLQIINLIGALVLGALDLAAIRYGYFRWVAVALSTALFVFVAYLTYQSRSFHQVNVPFLIALLMTIIALLIPQMQKQ